MPAPGPEKEPTDWLFLDDAVQAPCSLSGLCNRLAAQQITLDHLVCRLGSSEWMPLRRLIATLGAATSQAPGSRAVLQGAPATLAALEKDPGQYSPPASIPEFLPANTTPACPLPF